MSIAEMRKEDVENTMMTYNRVRKGGPKDKRIRKVELMGEHTAKPLHYVKITQSAHLPLVDVRIIMDECERRVGDVGDAYRPIIEETKQEREFTIVGFYKRDHALICAQKMADGDASGETIIDNVPMQVEVAKSWFVDLYPRPATAKMTDYRKMFALQEP